MDQPGTVAKWPAEQVKLHIPCPRSRLRTCWSRETGSAVPSRVSPLILHIQAESGAYSRFRDGAHTYILPTAIGSVLSYSGRVIAYRWCLLQRVRRHRVSSSQGSSRNARCLLRFHHGQLFSAPVFSHAHYYWYVVYMWDVESIGRCMVHIN